MIVSLFAHIHLLPKPGEEKVGYFFPKSYKNGEKMVLGGKGWEVTEQEEMNCRNEIQARSRDFAVLVPQVSR